MGLKKIILACGGTGGHVFPALAVGRSLSRRHGVQCLLAGRAGTLEDRLAQGEGIPFLDVPAVPLHRSRAWRNLALPVSLWRTVRAARTQVRQSGAVAVFATGGFVSLPTGLAARMLGLPVFLLEPNAHPGVANRLLGRVARRIFAGSPACAGVFDSARTEVTGSPCRPLDARTREERRAALGIDPQARLLLVLGGSQGAAGVNRMLETEARDLVAAGWTVLWQTGPRQFEAMEARMRGVEGVRVQAFVDDVYAAMGSADLCVSRSGASTLGELALHGLPAVLVPYPFATDNHQESNAREFERAGAALVLVESSYLAGHLLAAVNSLFEKRATASQALTAFAHPEASDRIADRVMEELSL